MIYAIVNKPVVPLLKDASFYAAVEDELVYGMKVTILNKCGEWYKIMTHYRYEGFVYGTNLLFNINKIENWNQLKKRMIVKNNADVLSGPRYQSSIMMSLPKSALAAGMSDDEISGFVNVRLVNGEMGYIRSDFLDDTANAGYDDDYDKLHTEKNINAADYINDYLHKSEKEFRNGLVSNALDYLGSQYRWGGRTPLGVDCSGLCFTAYMIEGLIIYRDSIIKEGFPIHNISLKNICQGDLLYFPGHIAMYLGEDKYIHSTGRKGSSGVVINSLNPKDEDYRKDLQEALYAAGSVFE